MNLIRRIKVIGETGICSDEDLSIFIPDFPIIHGTEFIFKISWANCRKYIDSEIINFVKGLHVIEEKYKEKLDCDFGFGSPSPTFKVIKKYSESNLSEALELEKWIAVNGGNYYVATISGIDDFDSKILPDRVY